MAVRFRLPSDSLLDSNANPLSGGTVSFYETGTTTPLDTYSDDTLTTANTNPVTLDSAGRHGDVFLSKADYKVVLKDSSGSVIKTMDPVHGGEDVTTTASITFTQAGTGAVSRTAQDKMREAFSVMDFGAVGDGSDDSAALDLAAAAALAAGAALLLPSGKTFAYNGQWSVGVDVIGYGATLLQGSATEVSTNAFGVLIPAADNITIEGLTVDGNLKSSGIYGTSVSNVTVRDCMAQNCIHAGIGFLTSSNVKVVGSVANNVRYISTGIGPADGFIFDGCTDCSWAFCEADDFRRIGFVSDISGSTKNDRILAFHCIAHNANNRDDSTTGQYNAAFWAENTNNIDWLYCTGYDLAGNAGQTSASLVIGMSAFNTGNNARGKCTVKACRIYGGNGYLNNGITVSGASTYADAIIEDCYLSKVKAGITTLCNLNSLTITRLSIDDIDASLSGAFGGIIIDKNGTNVLNYLTIDDIKITNGSFHNDAAWIVFYSTPSGVDYTLKNVHGATHVMVSDGASPVKVENSSIVSGSDTYESFRGTNLSFVNVDFTPRSGVTLPVPVLHAAGSIKLHGGSLIGAALWAIEISGSDLIFECIGVKHDFVRWDIAIGGTYVVTSWIGCQFKDIDSTGCIKTNFSAPTTHYMIADGNAFNSGTAANTPIQLWNTNPNNTGLKGNVWNTTSLFTLTTNVRIDNIPAGTVAALPTASALAQGQRAYVTDATATAFASTVTGGGSNTVPVYSTGSAWLIG